METPPTPQAKHIGRKISRIREMRGIKQEALAIDMGITQQAISHIEQSETVEEETLDRVAKALGVTAKAIESFNEESVSNYFNNFNDNSTGAFHNHNCTFNPLDKVVELYERLLESEREKVELLKGQSKR